MTPSVTRLSRNALASSAIRCRFVDRFARPKVLSHVARQRFSPRDAPLSSIGSRRDQFSDVISTMRALRLPTHASPVTYLFRFRGPRDSSSVRARRCQRSRAVGGGPATGQDHCSAGDLKLPAHLHVDASGTSQVPRRPILCLCPVPRPRPDRRTLAITVSSMLPLLTGKQRLQRNVYIEATAGLKHLLSTLQERCCHRHMQDSLPAGWLAFAVRESNPLDRGERFPSTTSLPPFLDLACRYRFETLAFFRRPSQVWRGLNAGPCTPPPFRFASSLAS